MICTQHMPQEKYMPTNEIFKFSLYSSVQSSLCTVQNNPKQFRTVHLCECLICKNITAVLSSMHTVQQYVLLYTVISLNCIRNHPCTTVQQQYIIFFYTKPNKYVGDHMSVTTYVQYHVYDQSSSTAYYITSGEYPDINVRE